MNLILKRFSQFQQNKIECNHILLFCLLVITILSVSTAYTQNQLAVTSRQYSISEVLAIAEKMNPSIAVFEANFSAAQGALKAARAFPNPNLGVDLGKGKSLEGDSEYRNEYGFSVLQFLEWPGKRSYRKKTAEAEVQVAQQDQEDFRLELRALVKEAFYNVLLSQKIHEVAQKNVETAQALFDSAKLRVESGEAPELEFIKAQVELLKIRRELTSTESKVLIAKSVLRSLMGQAIDRNYEANGDFPETEKPYDLQLLTKLALSQHPQIRRQEKILEAAGYNLQTEKQSRIPDVEVNASLGKEIDKRSYSFGFLIPIPLLYQRQGEIAIASAGQSRAEAELQRTRLELERQITQEFQNYQIAINELEVFREGLIKQAEEAVRIAQLSYQEGETGLLDLLDAQRTLRSTLAEYYNAQFELQASLARLERVTGGLPQ